MGAICSSKKNHAKRRNTATKQDQQQQKQKQQRGHKRNNTWSKSATANDGDPMYYDNNTSPSTDNEIPAKTTKTRKHNKNNNFHKNNKNNSQKTTKTTTNHTNTHTNTHHQGPISIIRHHGMKLGRIQSAKPLSSEEMIIPQESMPLFEDEARQRKKIQQIQSIQPIQQPSINRGHYRTMSQNSQTTQTTESNETPMNESNSSVNRLNTFEENAMLDTELVGSFGSLVERTGSGGGPIVPQNTGRVFGNVLDASKSDSIYSIEHINTSSNSTIDNNNTKNSGKTAKTAKNVRNKKKKSVGFRIDSFVANNNNNNARELQLREMSSTTFDEDGNLRPSTVGLGGVSGEPSSRLSNLSILESNPNLAISRNRNLSLQSSESRMTERTDATKYSNATPASSRLTAPSTIGGFGGGGGLSLLSARNSNTQIQRAGTSLFSNPAGADSVVSMSQDSVLFEWQQAPTGQTPQNGGNYGNNSNNNSHLQAIMQARGEYNDNTLKSPTGTASLQGDNSNSVLM